MKRFLLILSLFAFVLSAVEIQPQANPAPKKTEDLPYKDLMEFMRVMQLIREKYVDSDRVTYHSLFQGAMRGMLKSLDPYSTYEAEDQFSRTVKETKGSFSGVGIVIRSAGNNIEVVSVTPQGPAQKAGILPGDLLIEAGGTKLQRKSVGECVRILQGEKGTPVKVRVYRRKTDRFFDFTLKRDVIKVSSLQNGGILPGNIACFRLTMFTATTSDDIDRFFKEHEKDTIRGVIVDLRNNPGGLLESAVDVSGKFLKQGSLVVSIEGRGVKTVRHYSKQAPLYPDLPMVILVNGNSASASEIFTGCMKDHRRAVTVGTRTFGKGLVQTLLSMPDKTGIRLTTARYYTPNRLPIDRKGILPDIVVPVTPGQEAVAMVRLMNRPDLAPVPGAIPADIQFERAYELLKGIILFKGSGK